MKTLVFYHGNCHDGFTGAFAAYKKFGKRAQYIPIFHSVGAGKQMPKGIKGADVYCIDFCYPADILEKIQAQAHSLTVIDHHIGSKDVIITARQHVFDNDHSGAVLAWQYFHPTKPVPILFKYIEDGDLWNYRQPHAKEAKNLLHTEPFDFKRFEELHKIFASTASRKKYLAQSIAAGVYRERLVTIYVEKAELVRFGKYKIFAVSAPAFLRSEVGAILAEKTGTFALVWRVEGNALAFSLRGIGKVDLSKIVAQFGVTGGHKNAAGFTIPLTHPLPLPFTPIKK